MCSLSTSLLCFVIACSKMPGEVADKKFNTKICPHWGEYLLQRLQCQYCRLLGFPSSQKLQEKDENKQE